MADDLEDLPPEERIKRLKELEKKRKQEIVEAQQQIRESENELKDRLKWKEKVPIPEFAQDELIGLSEEAKEILVRDRGIRKQFEDVEEVPLVKEGASLEEALGGEELMEIPPEVLNADYTRHLSQEPVKSLYAEMAQLQESVEQKGYMSSEDERKVEYMMGAVERKREEGYSFSEDAARAASVTQQIGANLRNVYKSSQSDVYRS
ncbi:MAG: hypothetical protein KKH52_04880 [Nanoarchaeota archaeon]|nr:hypothetical protein [Nanoarchaeota archaeon]MBU1622592.1 hypothetical protein [Nanoarchaeota archaeon]MBU1974701.1 hypothetical protein [Nanoarchaeota archaeon]